MPLELLRSPGEVVGGEAATEARFIVRLVVGLSVLDFLFDGITISSHRDNGFLIGGLDPRAPGTRIRQH